VRCGRGFGDWEPWSVRSRYRLTGSQDHAKSRRYGKRKACYPGRRYRRLDPDLPDPRQEGYAQPGPCSVIRDCVVHSQSEDQEQPQEFPEEYAFQLTREEFNILLTQIAVPGIGRGGRVKLPWVLTEKGVAKLSILMRDRRVVQINRMIDWHAAETRPTMNSKTSRGWIRRISSMSLTWRYLQPIRPLT
jgi:hypothetical protein